MAGPQEVRDVMKGLGGEQGQRPRVDGQHILATELGGADEIRRQLAVGRRVFPAGEHLLELELGHDFSSREGAVKPQKARRVYFFRKLSSLTILEAGSSGLASGPAAASGLAAAASDGAPSEGRFSGAGREEAGWLAPASAFAPAPGLSLRSNCSPKRTDGSTKADRAPNGTFMRS